MVSISRALLRKTSIVLVDEATSNIDQKTEQMITEAMKTCFANSTVLVIAHKIQTIMDSDKVLVLSQGRVKEFDTPSNLLGDPNTLFSQYVQILNESKC